MRNEFSDKRLLGRTSLEVGRLGISSSYGAPAAAFEAAFERGCNYFTWGTFIKGRSSKMATAIRNITAAGRREHLVLAMLTYAHNAFLTEHFFIKGLQAAGLDYADILLLGHFSRPPSRRIIDGALKLKDKGLVRFVGLTSHNRKLFPRLVEENILDVFHIRYSAVHRGAETETFPFMDIPERPGVVSFTATNWGNLLKARKMPPDETAPTAAECYRFVLSNPAVDICMSGAKTMDQMQANLSVLEQGPMDEEELTRMRKIGDHLH